MSDNLHCALLISFVSLITSPLLLPALHTITEMDFFSLSVSWLIYFRSCFVKPRMRHHGYTTNVTSCVRMRFSPLVGFLNLRLKQKCLSVTEQGFLF